MYQNRFDLSLRVAYRLVNEIEKLATTPDDLNRMEEASRKLAHGDSAAAAVDMIEELIT